MASNKMISVTLIEFLLGTGHFIVTLCLCYLIQFSQQPHNWVSLPFFLLQIRKSRHREVSQ